jgi:hypothetical protein
MLGAAVTRSTRHADEHLTSYVKLTSKMISGDPLTTRGQGFQLARALHLVVAQTKLIKIMVNLMG